jgi:hypothetical protein
MTQVLACYAYYSFLHSPIYMTPMCLKHNDYTGAKSGKMWNKTDMFIPVDQ